MPMIERFQHLSEYHKDLIELFCPPIYFSAGEVIYDVFAKESKLKYPEVIIKVVGKCKTLDVKVVPHLLMDSSIHEQSTIVFDKQLVTDVVLTDEFVSSNFHPYVYQYYQQIVDQFDGRDVSLFGRNYYCLKEMFSSFLKNEFVSVLHLTDQLSGLTYLHSCANRVYALYEKALSNYHHYVSDFSSVKYEAIPYFFKNWKFVSFLPLLSRILSTKEITWVVFDFDYLSLSRPDYSQIKKHYVGLSRNDIDFEAIIDRPFGSLDILTDYLTMVYSFVLLMPNDLSFSFFVNDISTYGHLSLLYKIFSWFFDFRIYRLESAPLFDLRVDFVCRFKMKSQKIKTDEFFYSVFNILGSSMIVDKIRNLLFLCVKSDSFFSPLKKKILSRDYLADKQYLDF